MLVQFEDRAINQEENIWYPLLIKKIIEYFQGVIELYLGKDQKELGKNTVRHALYPLKPSFCLGKEPQMNIIQ